ncbi:MAG: hypothetical protein WEB78_10085 [Ilumatobacteraceae bacterium]
MSETPYDEPPDGRPPSDNTTVQAVLAAYEEAGFVAQFTNEPAGSGRSTGVALRCSRCTSIVSASAVAMHSLRRMEGASDPADMLAVVALTCPVCGAEGTAVVSYGPMASAEDSDLLLALRDRRDDDRLPPGAPPAESGPHDQDRW